jgi:excisionase family DNA binding protein
MDESLKVTPQELANAFADPAWAGKFPPLLDVDQAAELMRVSKLTIYDWSSRGLLRGCGRKVGKRLRFFRDRLLVRALNEGLAQ